ncbi:MAG: GIY-YIG nuclease family protein [Sphingobacteriales bacterium]|nr:GIY-YIG nuclease family protein [Sphingobacteriales bacterium]
MAIFVYILYSQKLKKFYTGTTTEVERRLAGHNSGVYEDPFTFRQRLISR